MWVGEKGKDVGRTAIRPGARKSRGIDRLLQVQKGKLRERKEKKYPKSILKEFRYGVIESPELKRKHASQRNVGKRPHQENEHGEGEKKIS